MHNARLVTARFANRDDFVTANCAVGGDTTALHALDEGDFFTFLPTESLALPALKQWFVGGIDSPQMWRLA